MLVVVWTCAPSSAFLEAQRSRLSLPWTLGKLSNANTRVRHQWDPPHMGEACRAGSRFIAKAET